MRAILFIGMLVYISIGSYSQNVFYVQDPAYNENASDINKGTDINFPWATLQHAFNSAQAGDTVYMRDGVWYPDIPVAHTPLMNGLDKRGYNGTYSNPICFFNYPGENPVLDCIKYTDTKDAHGLLFRYSTYVKLRGLEVRNKKQLVYDHWIATVASYDVGVMWLEQCKSHDNGGYGFQAFGFDTIYYINCDSYNNYDTWRDEPGNRSDGFAGGSGGTETDTFKMAYYIGCRAWGNSDDGIDIGTSKQFEVYNCWCFNNGNSPFGGGNGFKTGPSHVRVPSKRKIHHTFTAFSKFPGNSELNLNDVYNGPVAEYVNNTAYKCYNGFDSSPNKFNCETGAGKVVYRNNLVYDSKYEAGGQAYLGACRDFPTYAVGDHNTWLFAPDLPWFIMNDSFDVSNKDFVLLDSVQAVAQLTAARNQDGSLPDISFLTLVSTSALVDAGVDVGFKYNGNAPDLGALECKYQPGTNNLYPIVEVISPDDGSQFTIGSEILFSLEANDDVAVSMVQFYIDDSLYVSKDQEPWEFAWKDAPIGNHNLRAKVIDNLGATATSELLTVSVFLDKSKILGESLIYPNPNNGSFHFVLREPLNANGTISIVTLEGKTVFEDTMPNQDFIKEINLSKFGSGLYILMLSTEDKLITSKFIKF